MKLHLPIREWGLAALVSLGLGQSAWGQTVPASAPPVETEVFVGTVKVAPIALPPAPIVIVQEAPKPEPKPEPKEEPKPRIEVPVFIPIVPAGAWGPMSGPGTLPPSVTGKGSQITPGNTLFHLMGQLMTRLVMNSFPKTEGTHQISTPHIVIIREPASEAKMIAPTPPPQIVVVRETAPAPELVPETSKGLQLSWEMLGMMGFASIGVLCVVFFLGRSNKGQVVVQTGSAIPATLGPPADYDPAKHGPLLDGKYIVGPLPETAERFDIGPSYHDELKAKERQAEAAKQAVVANVLMQNLDLFDVEEKPA